MGVLNLCERPRFVGPKRGFFLGESSLCGDKKIWTPFSSLRGRSLWPERLARWTWWPPMERLFGRVVIVDCCMWPPEG